MEIVICGIIIDDFNSFDFVVGGDSEAFFVNRTSISRDLARLCNWLDCSFRLTPAALGGISDVCLSKSDVGAGWLVDLCPGALDSSRHRIS